MDNWLQFYIYQDANNVGKNLTKSTKQWTTVDAAYYHMYLYRTSHEEGALQKYSNSATMKLSYKTKNKYNRAQ